MKLRQTALAMAGAIMLAGCASVTRGTTEHVQFVSVPAGAQVTTTAGITCTATPCSIEMSRKMEFIASFEKEGYQRLDIPVSTKVSGGGAAGMAGNIILGGVVGIVADAATGATLDHYPNPVAATLVPLPQNEPAKKRLDSRSKKPAPSS
ncbi:translation initiation factor 2 [Labrys monachus]|uniref:Translation initiation factor 2 n=1 Tax=Labrys monachus TaxID=217067 RepID=A0ABU0FKG7_9HYPH|nr:translation initiation factor 2 [Labrys monachus]MDQ0394847.1 hypothetical protein [Labrys monachus]